MHKFFAKIPACTSQKRGQFIYLSQVASRLKEQQMLTQARYMYQVNDSHREEKKPPKTGCYMRAPLARVTIRQGHSNQDPAFAWMGESKPSHGLHPLIINSVCQVLKVEGTDFTSERFLISKTNGALYANIYPEANLNGRLFRCHPDHQQEGPWYDWVMISWEINLHEPRYSKHEKAPRFWSPPTSSVKKNENSKKISGAGIHPCRAYTQRADAGCQFGRCDGNICTSALTLFFERRNYRRPLGCCSPVSFHNQDTLIANKNLASSIPR